jgi:energy-coupling factor transport system permease protein
VNSVRLNGWKKYLAGLRLLSILFLVVVIFNPLTNHRGATPLFRLWGDPITLEATVFGLCAGGMLVSAFVWFQCYQKLITNDKFLFLFARIAPVSAMVVSMILKFIPVTGLRYREITEAQKGLLDEGLAGGTGPAALKRTKKHHRPAALKWLKSRGRSISLRHPKNRVDSIRRVIRIFGVLMSLSMEGSIETASSMCARGYGVGKRTFFSAWRLRMKDFGTMLCIGILFVLTIIGMTFLSQEAAFFPQLAQPALAGSFCVALAGYAAMLLLPLILEGCVWFWGNRQLRKQDGDH